MAEVDALLLENGLLPINDSRWERLIADLHSVCSQKNDTLAALQHLVNQASQLIEWVPADATTTSVAATASDESTLSQEDIELLLQQSFAFLTASDASSSAGTDGSQPVQPLEDARVIAPMMRILVSTEKDTVLHRALQASQVLGSKRDGAAETDDYPVDALRSWISTLAASATRTGGFNLQLLLVLIKLLLSLIEECVQHGGGKLDESSKAFDSLSSSDFLPILRQRIPSRECIERQLRLVRKNENIRQFAGEPRLCIAVGQPETLSKDAVTGGELAGFVSSVSIRANAFYYEAVIDTMPAAAAGEKLRFGWAVCGSEFSNDTKLLGADKNSWSFNKEWMQKFHDANAVKAERQKASSEESVAPEQPKSAAAEPAAEPPAARPESGDNMSQEEAEMQSLFDLFDDSDAALAAQQARHVEYGGFPCGEGADEDGAQHRRQPWRAGDVFGSVLDCEQRVIRFFLNGKEVANSAFESVEIPPSGLTPAFSVTAGVSVQFNFGDKPFKFVPNGFHIPAAVVTAPDVPTPAATHDGETKSEQPAETQETKAPEPLGTGGRPLLTIREAVRTTSIRFDGNAWVTVASDTPLKLGSGMSISACVQLTTDDQQPDRVFTILSRGGQHEPCGYRFGVVGNGALTFRVNGVYEYVTKPGLVPRNEWTEVTVTYAQDAHTATFFVDGQQVEIIAAQPKPNVPVAAVKHGVIIGALRFVPPEATAQTAPSSENTATTEAPAEEPTTSATAQSAPAPQIVEHWIGDIADIRVWSACKPISELRFGRLSTVGNEKDLAAYWRFAEGAGLRLHDCAPSATIWSPCHGTLEGSACWHDFALEPLIQAPDAEVEMDRAAREQADRTGLVNVLQTLATHVNHNLDELAHTGGPHRELQLRLAPAKLLLDPHVLHFLLARSILAQAFRLLQVVEPAVGTAVSWATVCVLNIIKANLRHVKVQNISVGSVGLMVQVPASSEALPFSQRLMTSILLFCCTSDPDNPVLLPWAIPDNDALDSADAGLVHQLAGMVRTSAIEAFAEGLTIFYPSPHDVLFLLEKLFVDQAFPVVSADVLPQQSPDVVLDLLSRSSRLTLQQRICERLGNWSSLWQLLAALLRVELIADKPSHNIAVGDIVHPTEHCIDHTPQQSSGRVIEITSWCGEPGKGVRVQWQSGAVNVYRYGVIFQGHVVYDVEPNRQFEAAGSEVSAAQVGDQASEEKTAPRPRMQVQYTAHEVRHALLDEIGSLTKRTVLRYLKEAAPEEWQQEHKLTWSESALLKELSAEDTVKLYEQFCQEFALEPQSPRTPSNRGGGEQVNDSPRVVRVLKAIIAQAMCSEDQSSEHTLSLLAGAQSLVLGAVVSNTSPTTGNLVPKPVSFDEKLQDAPFTGQTRPDKKWVWKGGQVVPYRPPEDPHATVGAESSSALHAQQAAVNPSAWRFDTTVFPDVITYSNDGATAMQTEKRRWLTLRVGKLMFPNTGIHRWTISVDACRKPHLAFGVCAPEALLSRPLMADATAWGIGMRRNVYANSVNISNEYGADIEEGEVVMATFDSDNGTVSFKNMSTLTDYGIAFGGIRTPVYPAVSVYHAGDTVTVGDASLFVAPTRPKAAPAPKVDASAGLSGIPPETATEYVAALIKACDTAASKAAASVTAAILPADALAAFTSNKIVALLPHALGRLARWQYPPLNAEDLAVGLTQLAKTIESLLEKAPVDTPARGCALHLLTVIACLQGRLLAFKIQGGDAQLSNELVAMEEAALQTEGFPTMKVSTELATQGVRHWLTNPLLQKGIRSPSEVRDAAHHVGHVHGRPWDSPEDAFVQDVVEGRGAAAALEEWISTHDTSPKMFRNLGGAVIGRAVRAVFASMLWHSGYITPSLKLAEHAHSVRERSTELFTTLRARVPPFFLLHTWQKAQNIRLWAKRCKDDGTAYEILGPNLVRRAFFLLDLEPMNPDQPAQWLIQDFISGEPTSTLARDAQHVRALEERLGTHTDHVLSFVKDGTRLHEITAALRFADDRAVIKANGYKALRVFLGNLTTPEFWPKIAALTHLPDAVRGVISSKFAPEQAHVPISDRRSNFQSGHYLFQLDGCSLTAMQMLNGSFDSLYAYLASELSTAAQEQIPELQMALLDCWGIMLSEQDHDMLARVRIFSVLQELLESTVPGEWVVSPGVRTPVSEEPTSPANVALAVKDAAVPPPPLVSPKRIAQAVMKLVYLLALQVASSGDETPGATAGADSGPLLGPTLSRARSGPATLSDAVFDMLFSQLTTVIQALADNHVKLGTTDRVLSITEEAYIVLSETSLLLTCVVVAPSCQRILMKPRWLAVLTDLVMLAPAVIRHRALRLLAVLLPQCDTTLLSSGSEVADALTRHLADEDVAAVSSSTQSVAAQVVALLWRIVRLQFAAPESETIVVVEGFGQNAVNNWDIIPLVSDAIGVLRQLLHCNAWASFVRQAVHSALQRDNSSFASHETLQALGVVCSLFGGYADSLFLGCGAELVLPEARADDHDRGIVVAIEPRHDAVDVAMKNKKDQRVLCKMNIDQVRPLNRTPFDLLAVDEALWVPVLSMAYRLCAASIEANGAATTSAESAMEGGEEKKESKELEESKEPTAGDTTPAASATTASLPFDLLVAMVQCTAARSVSSILSQACIVSGDHLSKLLLQEPTLAELGSILLNKAVTPTRSCGLGDVVVLEDYAQLLSKNWRRVHAHSIVEASKKQTEEQVNTATTTIVPSTPAAPQQEQVQEQEQEQKQQQPEQQQPEQLQPLTPATTEAQPSAGAVPVAQQQQQQQQQQQEAANADASTVTVESSNVPAASEPHPLVAQLEAMGFPTAWCVRALELNNFDVEGALNYILANGDELENMTSADNQMPEQTAASGLGALARGVEPLEDMADFEENEAEEEESPTAATMPSEISEMQPCDFHYVHSANKLLPLFAAPNFNSDRLAALFPGDDVLAIGVDGDWLKVNLGDYDEEVYESDTAGDSAGPDAEPVAWVPRFVDGQEVIRLGRSKNGNPPPLASPPADTFPLRATFQVVGSHGLRVREGPEMASLEVTVLSQGELILTVEETINSEGSLRMLIQKPVRGWVTKRRSLVKKIGGGSSLDAQDEEQRSDQAAASLGPVNEEQLLEQVEDNMENSVGDDLYRKDDRYFGSMQGKAFSANAQDAQQARRQQVNRRSRLTGANSSGAAEQAVSQQSVAAIQAGIIKVASTLANLHCRAALFALMVQSVSFEGDGHVIDKFLPHTPGAQAPATGETSSSNGEQTHEAGAELILTGCHICEQLSTFVRLNAFRGEHLVNPLWRTRIQQQLDTLHLHDKFVSAETLVGLFIQRVLASVNRGSSAKESSHADDMLQALYQQISRHLRLATTPSHADMCWDEHYADEDEDAQCLRNCNIPYAQWLTKLIVQSAPLPDVFVKLFRFWTVGLRGASLSLKYMTCKLLSEMLLGLSDPQPASFSQQVHQAFSSHSAAELESLRASCVAMLPEARLRRLAAMRYAYELEEHPLYSRYLQSLVLLLDSITSARGQLAAAQASNSLQEHKSVAVAAAAADEEKHQASDATTTTMTRHVVKFGADRSHVTFAPQQEIEGPWTVEFWLIRDHANLEIVEPKRSTSSGATKRKEQVPWGVKKVPIRSAGAPPTKPGPTRSPRLVRSDSAQAESLGLFGHAQEKPVFGGGFGQPPEQSLFGQQAAPKFGSLSPPSSLFGSGPVPTPAFSSFGSASNSSPFESQSQPNFGLFGSPPEPAFGGRGSGSLFGNGGGRGGRTGGRSGGRTSGRGGPGGRGGRHGYAEWAEAQRDRDRESPVGRSASPSDGPTAPGIRPSYLLRSPNVDIKLQLGGRLFGELPGDDVDSLVPDKALCFALSMRGGEEHVFDYVVPTGKWTHLALVCRNNPRQIELYENGQLVDVLPIRASLPLAMIGDKNAGSSFDGRLADMRVWGYARSVGELARDMLRDVSGFRGLLAYLPCNEGQGERLLDHAHTLAACSLHECAWVAAADAPVCRPVDVPRHLLREEESANAGIYDTQESLHLSTMDLDQTEMTGILTRMACSGAAGELSKQVSEVVSLYFQHTSSDADTDGWMPILGYLHWNEAEARSIIKGGVKGQAIRFTLGDVIQGCPKSVQALTGAMFTGELTEDGLQGEWELHTRVPALPPLAKGTFRVDRAQLPESISATKQGANPHLAVIGNSNLPCTAMVEANPFENVRKPSSIFALPTSNMFSNHDVKDAVSAAASFVEDMFSRVTGEETKIDSAEAESKQDKRDNTDERAADTDTDAQPFGFVSGKHWLSWLVGNSRSGNLTLGFCAFGASATELAGANANSWGYRANGQTWHASECKGNFSSFSQMDVIALELDLADGLGTARFYKNGMFEGVQFTNLLSHSSFSAADPRERGLRVCISLTDVSESVTFLGYQSGRTEISFTQDAYDRQSFSFDLQNGYAEGNGILRYKHSRNYWRGRWSADKQHGVQLYITVDEDGEEISAVPYLFDRGIQIRQATNLEAFDLLEEWKANREAAAAAKQAALAGGEESEDASKDAEKRRRRNKKKSKGHAKEESSEPTPAPGVGGGGFSFGSPASLEQQHLPQQATSPFGNPFASAVAAVTAEVGGVATPSQPPVTTPADVDARIAELVATSTAPYLLQIVCPSGATVRAGIEIDESAALRSIQMGEIVEAFSKAQTKEGIGRYQLSDGWISERLRSSGEEPVTKLLRYLPPRPIKYQITYQGGAKLREDVALDSKELGSVPADTVVEVAEQRRCVAQDTLRLRIVSPPEYVGWISLKPHLAKLLEEVDQIAVNTELQRRATVRRRREERKSTVKEEEANQRFMNATIKASMSVSSKRFFLLNKKQCSSGIVLSDDLLTATCDPNVQSESSGFGGGRSMVMATRGFTRGVHYWEVQVNSAQWGSVFIGVAPKDSNNWNGYGFLNYRATQRFGSETLYGSYYGSGDTVGVLLDMDHGTIAFVKDGEDFNVGKMVVNNMGIAYHNLRRSSRSALPELYPCFGMKSSGDQLSISRSRWFTWKGCAEDKMLENALESLNLLRIWQRCTARERCLPQEITARLYPAYRQWRNSQRARYRTRAGVEVEVDASEEALSKALGPLADAYPVMVGQKIQTMYGEGKIVGVFRGDVWFTLEGNESGAWYWSREQLMDLVGSGMVNLEMEGGIALTRQYSDLTKLPLLSEAEFQDASGGLWTSDEDEQLTRLVNKLSDSLGVDPFNIPPGNIIQAAAIALPSKTAAEIQSRFVALRALNKAGATVLPLVDVGRAVAFLGVTEADLQTAEKLPSLPLSVGSASSSLVRAMRGKIFTRVKSELWQLVLRETTTFTQPPPDEYERPDEIQELVLNRMQAHQALQSAESLSFDDKLRMSLFGQLLDAISGWDDRQLRRSFVHMQDAGQPRAFYVKFTGEGVDDHGGPYRAAFQTAVGEEPQQLLDILTPCPNAKNAQGENRDKFVLNTQPQYGRLLRHLGRMLGLACRHRILVPLALPSLVWRPLCGAALRLQDLQAVDLSLMQSLNAIEHTPDRGPDVAELLKQALGASADMVPAADMQNLEEAEMADTTLVSRIVQLVYQLQLAEGRSSLQHFYHGLSGVVPVELFNLFTPFELEATFCGEPDVSVELLKRVTEYDCVSPTDPHIEAFWRVVEEMTPEERSALINFCSGRARLPGSAQELHMNFKLTAPPPRSVDSPDDYLPIAQTCFFSLSLPRYSSQAVLAEKLRYAIFNANLMDADFMMRNAQGWENIH